MADQCHLLAAPDTAADVQLSLSCGGINLKPQRNKHPIKRQRLYGEAVTRDHHGLEVSQGSKFLQK